MKRLKKLSKKIASNTFSLNSKSGASAVTKVYSERLNTLHRVEGVFYNLSDNFIEMAKAMDASTTTLKETKDSLRQQINEKQRADEEASLEKKSNKEKLFSKVVSIGGDNSSSLFDQIAQSLQTIINVLSAASSSPDLPDVDKGKGKGKGSGKGTSKAGKFKIPKALKVGGKVLGGVGLAVGAYEASEYLKETGYGNRMAKGEGGRAEKAFKEKKTDFSSQPLTADEAKSILDGNNPRDIEAFGGKERLEKIAGLQKPPIAATTQYNYKDTSVGGGRTTLKDDPRRTDFVKAEVSTSVKTTFTPSQLKWLGDADPTDPVILSRLPPPEPGEVGGPPLEAPKPVVQVAKPKPEPVVRPAPAPVDKPVPPPPAPVPSAKPPVALTQTPSGTAEPLVKKISAQSGKQAMIDEMNKQGITDPVKRAAIMAQAAVETGGFQFLSENLAYSAARMKQVFGRLKNTPIETIEQAIKQGVKGIGTLVYGGDPSSPSYQFGVKNLGNVQPGDGFKYRGRGFIQLTGRSNYAKAGALDEPEKLIEIKPAAETAVNFANRYKGDYSDVKAFTKFVNGGQVHVKERGEFFEKFLNDPSITTPQIMTTTPSTGVQTAMVSADVGSAKKQQAGQTIYNINNSTSTAIKVGAPQGSSTTVARPVGTA